MHGKKTTVGNAAQDTTPSATPPGTKVVSDLPVLVDGKVTYQSDAARGVVIREPHASPTPPLPPPQELGRRLFQFFIALGLVGGGSVPNAIAALFAPLLLAMLPTGVRRPVFMFNGLNDDADADALARLISKTVTTSYVHTLRSSPTLRRSPTGQLNHARDMFGVLRSLPQYVVIAGQSGPLDGSSLYGEVPGCDVAVTDREYERLVVAYRATCLVEGEGLLPAPDIDSLARVIDIAEFAREGTTAFTAARDEIRSLMVHAVASYEAAGCPLTPPVSSKTAAADGLLGGLLAHIEIPGYGERSTPQELAACGIVDEMAVLLSQCSTMTTDKSTTVGATDLFDEAGRLGALPRCVRKKMTPDSQMQCFFTWLKNRIDRSAGGYVLRGEYKGGQKAWRYRIEKVDQAAEPTTDPMVVGGDD